MPLTTIAVKGGALGACGAGASPGDPTPFLSTKAIVMPRRCTRRADKEEKVIKPRFLKARLSDQDHQDLQRIANERGIKVSRLTRTILKAHLKGLSVPLPHPRGLTDELVHQLARIGNNLNQLAHQANSGYVAVSAAEIRSCISLINTKVAQL